MLLKYPVNSRSTLLTSVLNSASDRLVISISFSSFSGVLFCSFIWAMFLQIPDLPVPPPLPLCPPLYASLPPTCMDECTFFKSLVLGLQYSSIFWQFWKIPVLWSSCSFCGSCPRRWGVFTYASILTSHIFFVIYNQKVLHTWSTQKYNWAFLSKTYFKVSFFWLSYWQQHSTFL